MVFGFRDIRARMRGAAILLILGACAADGSLAETSPVGPVPAYPQRDGDPAAGWIELETGGYVGCGVPKSAYDKVAGQVPAQYRLADRTGDNAALPYNLTAFTAKSGVEVVAPNCLQCHAEMLNGQLVIGLGSHTADYTQDLTTFASLSEGLVDPADHDEWQHWFDRVKAIGPYTVTATIGVNPADNLAAALFAHRDPDTLAWSDDPLLPLPPPTVVPVDPPPWWRMKKKHAMFYDAAGRGDHARIMMTASTLCVDDVDQARAIDATFPDVRAYIEELQPPAYPWAIDQEKAAAGHTIYAQACASCHGDGDDYPNQVIAIDDVGTDPMLATGTVQFAGPYVDWFNRSFFGELSTLAPAPGYIAPPLDGIWATAPYLHNGSVPTLRALLDSRLRPRYFTLSTDTSDYDQVNLGWHFANLDHGQAGIEDHDTRVAIYDTTIAGYSNRGHTFGDSLTLEERDQLLEYLKTL